jgi:hypothetical protein
MSRRLNVLIGIGIAAVSASSCSNGNPAAADADLLVDEIQIDSVDVRVLESSPPQAVAHVQGILGDGCSELRSESQTRLGNLVLVTILRERPREAVCTQIAKLYVADIPLKGEYPPGRYLLRVNEVEKTFTTE